jgi:hypothetical protein
MAEENQPAVSASSSSSGSALGLTLSLSLRLHDISSLALTLALVKLVIAATGTTVGDSPRGFDAPHPEQISFMFSLARPQ